MSITSNSKSSPPKVVAVISGGLDSVVMAHQLVERGSEVTALSFNYGQRHHRELDAAQRATEVLQISHRIVDVSALGLVLTGSALTDVSIDVPDGSYNDESLRSTVVPNRNAIFLSIATGVAVVVGAEAVAIAVHSGDHALYPDCRPEFIAAFEHQARIANSGFIHPDFHVDAPFLSMTKGSIVRLGAEYGVDFAATWSCYQGAELHCGTCATCLERREAFVSAEVTDPTPYMDLHGH